MDLIHILPSVRAYLEVDWMNLLMQAPQIFPLSVEGVGNNSPICASGDNDTAPCGAVVLPNSSEAT